MEKIILDDFSRHITMYTKNYYQKTDTTDDIKQIIAGVSGLQKQHISIDAAYQAVMGAFLALAPLNKRKEEMFWLEFFRNHHIKTCKPEMSKEDMVGHLLGFISVVRVVDEKGEKLIELGKPDYNILPPDPKRIF